MKNLTNKNKSNCQSFKLFETRRFIIKSASVNKDIIFLTRLNILKDIIFSEKHYSRVIISNRCIETNRKKRLNKYYSYSRIVFRKLVRQGGIVGYKKSSW